MSAVAPMDAGPEGNRLAQDVHRGKHDLPCHDAATCEQAQHREESDVAAAVRDRSSISGDAAVVSFAPAHRFNLLHVCLPVNLQAWLQRGLLRGQVPQ